MQFNLTSADQKTLAVKLPKVWEETKGNDKFSSQRADKISET